MQDALIRTCAEQPSMYQAYDAARRQAAKANRPPHARKVTAIPAYQADEERLLVKLSRRASDAGLSLQDWLLTPEGKAAYADYDEKFKGRGS